jgi:hypothetical protein
VGGLGEGLLGEVRLRYLYDSPRPVHARTGRTHQELLREEAMNDTNNKPGNTAGSKNDVQIVVGTAKTIAAVKK